MAPRTRVGSPVSLVLLARTSAVSQRVLLFLFLRVHARRSRGDLQSVVDHGPDLPGRRVHPGRHDCLHAGQRGDPRSARGFLLRPRPAAALRVRDRRLVWCASQRICPAGIGGGTRLLPRGHGVRRVVLPLVRSAASLLVALPFAPAEAALRVHHHPRCGTGRGGADASAARTRRVRIRAVGHAGAARDPGSVGREG